MKGVRVGLGVVALAILAFAGGARAVDRCSRTKLRATGTEE